MANFRNDVKQLIAEEREELAKEFGVPVHHFTVTNKVCKPKLKKKKPKRKRVVKKKYKKVLVWRK